MASGKLGGLIPNNFFTKHTPVSILYVNSLSNVFLKWKHNIKSELNEWVKIKYNN